MNELAKLGVILAIILIPILLFIVIISILQIIGQWKLFKKAGKKGWEAIIPYYNMWTLIEISGCKWWYFLIIIGSSLLSFYISFNINESTHFSINMLEGIGLLIYYFIIYCVNYNIAKKFNKDHGFAIGLTLIPFVFYLILGFGKYKFNNDEDVSPYGVIKEGEI